MDPLLASFKLACFTGEFYSDGVKVVIVKISRVRDVVLDYEQLLAHEGQAGTHLCSSSAAVFYCDEMLMHQGQEGWWRKRTENAGGTRCKLENEGY